MVLKIGDMDYITSARWRRPYTRYFAFTFVQWEEVATRHSSFNTVYGLSVTTTWALAHHRFHLDIWKQCRRLCLLSISGNQTSRYKKLPVVWKIILLKATNRVQRQTTFLWAMKRIQRCGSLWNKTKQVIAVHFNCSGFRLCCSCLQMVGKAFFPLCFLPFFTLVITFGAWQRSL